MPQTTPPGPWEITASPVDPRHDVPRPVLFHAVIRPNHADDRSPRLILMLVGFIAVGLSLPSLMRGEPIVAILFLIELTALALMARVYRRWANGRFEELNLFNDSLEITTRIGGRVSTERLPTAWLKIEPVDTRHRAAPGFVVSAAERELRIGSWLGLAQSQDLHKALEDGLALARRGLSASITSTSTWCSRTALADPVDPTLWAGGSGRS